jgi:hypothetical protein
VSCWYNRRVNSDPATLRTLLGASLLSGPVDCEGSLAAEFRAARSVVVPQVLPVVRAVRSVIVGPGIGLIVSVSQQLKSGTSQSATLTARAGSDSRVLRSGPAAAGLTTRRGEVTVSLQNGTGSRGGSFIDSSAGALETVAED